MSSISSEQLTAYLDDELTELEAERVRLELDNNPQLEAEYEQLMFARDFVRSHGAVEPPADFESRLRERIQAEPRSSNNTLYFWKNSNIPFRTIALAASAALVLVMSQLTLTSSEVGEVGPGAPGQKEVADWAKGPDPAQTKSDDPKLEVLEKQSNDLEQQQYSSGSKLQSNMIPEPVKGLSSSASKSALPPIVSRYQLISDSDSSLSRIIKSISRYKATVSSSQRRSNKSSYPPGTYYITASADVMKRVTDTLVSQGATHISSEPPPKSANQIRIQLDVMRLEKAHKTYGAKKAPAPVQTSTSIPLKPPEEPQEEPEEVEQQQVWEPPQTQDVQKKRK